MNLYPPSQVTADLLLSMHTALLWTHRYRSIRNCYYL